MKNRYGVVNELARTEYEKEWQIPMGYEFITFDKEDAIRKCKAFKGEGYVVEEISYDNKREIIYKA